MRKVKQALEMANREVGFGRVGALLVLAVLVDDHILGMQLLAIKVDARKQRNERPEQSGRMRRKEKRKRSG
ncbi:hypothetical protein CCHR01_16310 [Colletotrichum chrysophilum]|uniref:Uncharacterized protein n=1 Tax=Colletotrichum chrysophilum TaxID=1836956 RepID=A0AAD9EAY4_9PEZI|nr:hypothetical protein CCHR01_16310 [Colletotrichum chrysophilum]